MFYAGNMVLTTVLSCQLTHPHGSTVNPGTSLLCSEGADDLIANRCSAVS